MKGSSFRVFYVSILIWILAAALIMFHMLARYSTRDFKQIFEKTVYMLAYSSKEVYCVKVVDGKVDNILMTKLIGNRPFSIGPGIFVDDNSVKLVLEKGNQMDYVEIPGGVLQREINSGHEKWFVTDKKGNVVLSNDNYANQPNWLLLENGNLLYTLAERLDDDYTLYYGKVVPWHFIFGLIGFIIIFLTGSNLLAASLKHQKEQIENMKASLRKIVEGKDLTENASEDLKELGNLVKKLRATVLKDKKSMEKLERQNEELLSTLEIEKETHDKAILNIYKTFGALIEEKVHAASLPIEKMMELALFIARELGISDKEELYALQIGMALHDIGILEENQNESTFHGKRHCLTGERYGKALKLSPLAIDIIKHHHETYNGTGFPDGLAGEGISMRVRIASAVIAYFEEKYRVKNADPIEKMKKSKHFEPKVLSIMEKWLSK